MSTEKVREQLAEIEDALGMLQSLVVAVAKKAGLSSSDFLSAVIEGAIVHEKAKDALEGKDVPEEIKEKVEDYLKKMMGESDEH
jgi:hypothetical protein